MNESKLKPRYDRAVVKNLPEEKYNDLFKTSLHIPEIAKGKAPMVQAKVIAAGPNCENLNEGDIVGYQNGAGTPWTVGKEEFLIIRDQDLMVVIEVDE